MLKYSCLLLLGLIFFPNSISSSNSHHPFLEKLPENQRCPRFRVEFSQKSVRKGSDVRAYFVLEEARNNVKLVTFNWAISDGEIRKGQGTPSIVIRTDHTRGTALTATLEVGFYPSNCKGISSSSIDIKLPR
jgi:hypothetical protein